MSDGPYNLWNPPPRPWTSPFEHDFTVDELEAMLADYVEPPHDPEFEALLRSVKVPVTMKTLLAWSD